MSNGNYCSRCNIAQPVRTWWTQVRAFGNSGKSKRRCRSGTRREVYRINDAFDTTDG